MEKRVISTDIMEEDYKIENSLRPRLLVDYIGQGKAKANLKVYIEAAKALHSDRGGRHWIMCCFMDRRDWERRHWRELLPTRWM